MLVSLQPLAKVLGHYCACVAAVVDAHEVTQLWWSATDCSPSIASSCRGIACCALLAAPLTLALWDAIAAHKLDQNDARAAPRGATKAAGPLPGHNTNNTKTLGPAISAADNEPAARLPRRFGSIDGHGQDRERGRDADENRAQVPQGPALL